MRVVNTSSEKKYPAYSVLMTVYKKDNPDYFRQSLQSMLTQSVKPNEVVVITDGIIPNELERVIDDLDKKYPDIINEIRLEENVGLGTALKIGVPKCNNELIARMDSDDISLPDRCRLQLEAFINNPDLDIVGYSIKEFSGDVDNIVGLRRVPETNEEIYKFSKLRDPFNHPTVMFRKKKVLESGNYGDYRKNQDTDLWIKMLSHNAVCMNLNDDQFRFRFDENTYVRRKNWLNTSILLSIRYNAWKSGFNTLNEFLIISLGQLIRYILPLSFQKIIYRFLKGSN